MYYLGGRSASIPVCEIYFVFRPKENKALFPAHRVTKINLMRAAAKIFFGKYVEINMVENSEFYSFLGHNH